MRAIVVDHLTEPDALEIKEVPKPTAAPGGLVIEVRAAGCNFFDILMVKGEYQVKPPFPFTPGGEISGVVHEVGEGVGGFAVGDRVLASPGLGGFAEFSAVPAASATRIPDAMSFEEGAALPIIYSTSYCALVDRARLQPGEDLLVHAAAGGVGIAAVQIGKALGARVIATAGGKEKLDVALRNGADEAIDYRAEDFVARVLELTDGKGADIIYDSVGGDVFDQSMKCIAWNGRLLVIGFASGRIPEVKANRILLKNIAVMGLNWGGHSVKDPKRVPEVLGALFELHAAGTVKPVVYKRYSLDAVPVALSELGSRKTYGKLVITP